MVIYYHDAAFKTGMGDVPYELAYATGDLMNAYLHDLVIAQEFARLNRQAMSDEICKGMKLSVPDAFECSVAEIESSDERLITFEAFRSGGNGGQNVHKVETGVRAIYGSIQNKNRAVKKLRKAIMFANEERKAQAVNDGCKRHTQITRGDAAAKFKGLEFKPF